MNKSNGGEEGGKLKFFSVSMADTENKKLTIF